MKTKLRIWIIPIVFIGISVAFFATCKKATVTPAPSYTCTDVPACGTGAIKCCVISTGTGAGYYEWNGTKYSFSSSAGVSAAATAVVNAACGRKSPTASSETVNQVLDQTKILFEEVKYNNQ